ncbi:MAG: OmpA family protein, partial [Myxococcota bacterium]
ELTYLSLGRRDIKAHVDVPDKPNQDLKLTLRYKRHDRPGSQASGGSTGASFVLEEIQFDTGKATLREGSYARLDEVAEYMTHKKSARIEVSGHTDNVGKPAANKTLSRKRAQAVRKYLISQGIAGSRIKAVGYGAERPIASNDTEKGRQKNRRIEVTEIRPKR